MSRRRGQYAAARAIYVTAIQRSDLDWPEAVYEAFTQFENIHGTVDTILQASRKIEKESEKLARRREKTAHTLALQAPVEPENSNLALTKGVDDTQQQAEIVGNLPTNENDNRVRR